MPRIENAGKNVFEWSQKTGNEPSQFDVCARCLELSKTLGVIQPAAHFGSMFISRNDEPEGDRCVETDDDMQEDYCQECDEPLTDEDIL